MSEKRSPSLYGIELGGRIAKVADLVGGKRVLAEKSNIKESQLYRYLKGANIPSANVLVDIAKTGDIDVSWLATGDGPMMRAEVNAKAPAIDEEFLIQVALVVDNVLRERKVDIPLWHRLRLIVFLYENNLESKRLDYGYSQKIISLAAPNAFTLDQDKEILNLIENIAAVEAINPSNPIEKTHLINQCFVKLAEKFNAPGLLMPLEDKNKVVDWLKEELKKAIVAGKKAEGKA